MPGVVGRREAHGQEVRGPAPTQALGAEQGLREGERELVHRRCEPHAHGEVAVVAVGMGKGAAHPQRIRLVGSVVALAGEVAATLVEQPPGSSPVALDGSAGVPRLHPGGIGVVVVAARHEAARALRVPEGLAGVAAREDGAPVLPRDAEHP